jgi:hypothetical protein
MNAKIKHILKHEDGRDEPFEMLVVYSRPSLKSIGYEVVE